MTNPTRRIVMIALALAWVVWFPHGRAALHAQAGGEVLTDDAVVQMVTAKVPKNLILTKIQSTRNTFDTTANGLVALYASKVPNDVIGAMLAATAPGSEVLTNEGVIKMVTSQLPKDLIVTKIRTTTPGFDLTATGLVGLSQNKVPQDIQTAMMTAAAAPRSATVPSGAPSAALSPASAAAPAAATVQTLCPDASEVTRAQSALEVDKQPDVAIQILQAIQQNHALCAAGLTVLGRAYLAEDDGADAKDAFQRALATGAEIAIDLQHAHGFGDCVGTLYVSAARLRWVSDTSPTETLDVPGSQVLQGVVVNLTPQRGGPWYAINLTVNSKPWNFEYLLYGKQYSYRRVGLARQLIVPSRKDDEVIRDVIVGAKSTQVTAPAPAAPAATTSPTGSTGAAARAAFAAPAQSPAVTPAQPGAPSALPDFREGESTDDVQKAMGKPSQMVPDANDKDTVIWIYATVKITFHSNKLVDVAPIKAELVGVGA